jgi:hypothetical protein
MNMRRLILSIEPHVVTKPFLSCFKSQHRTQDAKELANLISQINHILEVKELRLKGKYFGPRPRNVEVDVANVAL